MAVFISQTSGSFSNGATWGNANPGTAGIDYPGSGDSFTVSSGHTVTVSADLSGTPFAYASINGTLQHSTSSSSKIAFGAFAPFIQFGPSGKYRMGMNGTTIPYTVTASLSTTYTGTQPWFIVDSANRNCFTANGAFPSGVTQYHSTLAAGASVGGTSFTTTDVIGPSSGSFQVLLDWTDGNATHYEIVTVSAYNQSTKVATCSALTYAHALGCRVWNLTRNVSIEGGGTSGGILRVNWDGSSTPLNIKHAAFRNLYSVEASQYRANNSAFTLGSNGTVDYCSFRDYRSLGVQFDGITVSNCVMANIYQGTALHCGSERQMTNSVSILGLSDGSYGLQAYEPFPGAYAKTVYISGGSTNAGSANNTGLAYVGAVYIDGCTVRGVGYGREDNFFYGNGKYKRDITFSNLLNANHLGTFNSGYDDSFAEYGTEFLYESTIDTSKPYIDRTNSDSFQNTFGFKYMDYGGTKGDFLFVYQGGVVKRETITYHVNSPGIAFIHESATSSLYYRVPVVVINGQAKTIAIDVRKTATGFTTRPMIGFCEAGKDPNIFTQGGFSYIASSQMTDSTNTWETLTLSFTPTFDGVGWLYLVSKAGSGTVYWSDPNY